jgi:hypothetical protein
MRLNRRGWRSCLRVSPLAFLMSGCLEGGDYQGGGRRLEIPGFVDVAADAADDMTTSDDASTADANDADATARQDDADALLDVPRSEPPLVAEDAGQGEAEAAPLDVAPADVRAERPPNSADASDATVDMAVRDVLIEPRRD